ncbi:uncharacterized protein LOC116192568 [Punica granatum]|uniref:Uncharacterized protein LOC116192568 n=1 Tax=Punica granatum TaxID=22663 RepID=A0A6P8C5K4_PUNGR|nr:uncharacterized protein LOC116192568 [Punica granatum]
MSHSVACPHLERITPPLEEITQIWTTLRQIDRDYITSFIGDIPLLATRSIDWNFLEAAITFWNPDHGVFNIQGNELTPTIEEYRTLFGRTVSANDIIKPNFCTTRPTLVSRLLGVRTSHLHAELAYPGGTEIAIEKLILFIKTRACKVQGNFIRKDLCHAFLLSIFGTILFPRSRALIDAALASVVLQVAGGHGYEVALVTETIRSLDHVLKTHDRRIRGSPILLQIWLQSHAYPFGLVRPVMYFANQESIISRLLPFVLVEERKINEWMKVFREISPRSFKWRAAWMPPGPMALKCANFNGIPLISHAGSTTYFPSRVMRQLGGLQTIPEDMARTKFEYTWREDQKFVDRQSEIEQALAAWHAIITEHPYFPEFPTQDEQDFQATEEYILHFHRWGPPAQDDTSQPANQTSPGAPSVAVRIELASLRAERDSLRRQVAEKDEQFTDRRQLQKELAQARAELQKREQELARVNIALEKSRKRAREQAHPI